MKRFKYNGIYIEIEEGSVMSENEIKLFFFNAWNYTKVNNSNPIAIFRKGESKFAYQPNGTNFGSMTNKLYLANHYGSKQVDVLETIERIAKKNKYRLLNK